MDQIGKLIRDVPDFPKPGVVFKDITPLLADAAGLAMAVELMANPYRGMEIDLVAGAESRGFIFGIAVARSLSVGFIPIRKKGKLPCRIEAAEYELEYGRDRLEIHADAIKPGQSILVVDDLVATGGTLSAVCELVRRLGGEIAGVSVLVELTFLEARKKLRDRDLLRAVLQY